MLPAAFAGSHSHLFPFRATKPDFGLKETYKLSAGSQTDFTETFHRESLTGLWAQGCFKEPLPVPTKMPSGRQNLAAPMGGLPGGICAALEVQRRRTADAGTDLTASSLPASQPLVPGSITGFSRRGGIPCGGWRLGMGAAERHQGNRRDSPRPSPKAGGLLCGELPGGTPHGPPPHSPLMYRIWVDVAAV